MHKCKLFSYTCASDSQRGTEIINAYNLAFFDNYLRNFNSSLFNSASSTYPEVTLESRCATGVPESTFIKASTNIEAIADLLVSEKG